MGACGKCNSAKADELVRQASQLLDPPVVLPCPDCQNPVALKPLFEEPVAPLETPALVRELALDRRKERRAPPPPKSTEPAWLVTSPPAAKPPPPPPSAAAAWMKAPEGVPLRRPTPPQFEAMVLEQPVEPAPEPLLVEAELEPELVEAADPEPARPVVEIHATPAAVGAQLGAWLVDAAVLGGLYAVMLVLAHALARPVAASEIVDFDWLVDRVAEWNRIVLPGVALLAALSFVYSALFHALGGRTLGKRLFGLTVVDRTGMPPCLKRSAMRAGLSLVSFAVCFLGFVFVLFDRQRQALHDKLSATFVVRLAD